MSQSMRAAGTLVVSGALGVLFLAVSLSILSAQTVPSPADQRCFADIMQEPNGCALALSALETRTLRIAIPAGSVRMVTAEQTAGTVELYLSEVVTPSSVQGAAEPYTNRAGIHSRIHILLSSGPQSVQTIRIVNPSKDPAAVFLSIAPASPANSLSEEEQVGEDAFAHADFLRSQGKKDKSAEALAAYDRAIATWRALGNQQELARALTWKADFLINNRGDATLALPVIQQAGDLLSSLDTVEAAHYWLIVGFINAVEGNYETVRTAYNAALSLYEKAGDMSLQAKILDNLSRIELAEGDTEAARSDETRASELATKSGDTRRLVFVQEQLGAIYSTLGDFESSYRAYGQALAQVKLLPSEPRMEAAIWVDLSDMYITLGDLDRARDALDQASEIWKRIDYSIGLVDTLNNYGELYLLKGQFKAARAYFQQGLELSEKIRYERGTIALMGGMGDSYLYQREAEPAEDILGRALIRAQKANQEDFETPIYCQLGDAAAQKRDFVRARPLYEKCRAMSVATKDVYHEIRADGGLARAAFEAGTLDEAQSHCEHALSGIEAIRGHLHRQELKTSFFSSQHAYYDLDIQILERLGQQHPSEGYAWQAFLIAERARARTLLDQIAATNADIRADASPALLAQYEDVQRRLRRLEASSSRQPAAQNRQASRAMSAAIARLAVSEHQLHQEILPNGKEDEFTPLRALTLESLESALPDRHATLVEYWVGEETSYVWSITRGGIRGFRLPPNFLLDRQCSAFRKALLAAASRDPRVTAEQRAVMQPAQEVHWRNLGARLSRTLFPAGLLLPFTSTVFVVGDGSIESVPFAALPEVSLGDTSKAPLRNVTFLNEPSATIFSLLEANPISPHPMRVALFTEEQKLPKAELRPAVQGTRNNPSPEFSALPFTGEEAALIRATIGANAVRVFSGASVSRASLQNLDWSEFSIGHFAMHAVLNDRYAELSGLALGDKPTPGSENLLWYGDVLHLHAKLDLVVLSACNTSLGEPVPGEGLRGLTQAFFAGGSQRVLGTLWEVDDQATSEWMRHFYQALKQTQSPTKALHDAQERMAADPQWSSPYYWAGFELAGDWRSLR
jgi:tetratricopeptide (TPR) repeat protein